ncbi:hypothetical protein KW797_02795 [Candidatus Parcubacteria bacterium]|nr:hypothetical protein [Candidatus Parcubacteria bacterium]
MKKVKIPSFDIKIPCNSTRFFFEKVEGKQFHPKFSGCDDFTVRIQIRKNKQVKWESVIHRLMLTDWLTMLQTKGVACGNATQLVSSFRQKKFGDHTECIKASRSFKLAMKKALKDPKKPVNYDWPVTCKLRK